MRGSAVAGCRHQAAVRLLLGAPACSALIWPHPAIHRLVLFLIFFPAPLPSALPSLPAGRELAKFMASVQALAYGSHNAELTSQMFRRTVDTKVGGTGVPPGQRTLACAGWSGVSFSACCGSLAVAMLPPPPLPWVATSVFCTSSTARVELAPSVCALHPVLQVTEHSKRRSFIEAGGGDAPY